MIKNRKASLRLKMERLTNVHRMDNKVTGVGRDGKIDCSTQTED